MNRRKKIVLSEWITTVVALLLPLASRAASQKPPQG
jgi:hypothetical protein